MFRVSSDPARRFAALVSILVLALASPAFADEPGPEPIYYNDQVPAGDTLLWRQTTAGEPSPTDPGSIVVIAPRSSDSDSARIYEYPASNLSGENVSDIDDHLGFAIESASYATSWGREELLVTDPAAGVVWKVGTGLLNLDLSPFAGVLPSQTGDELCMPVAVASYRFGLNWMAWYAEGSTSDDSPPWTTFENDCGGDEGGVHRRSSTVGSIEPELPGGLGPGQVPVSASKGLAVDWTQDPPELVVVTGHGVDGDTGSTPRILRKPLNSAGPTEEVPINWYLPPDGAVEGQWNLVDNPAYVAPLGGSRLAIGGRTGLKVYDRDGSWLQDIWIRGWVEQDPMIPCTDLVGLASDPEGDFLYALFHCTGGPRLAMWDTTQLASMTDLEFRVGHDLTDGGCQAGADGSDVDCDTIGGALAIAPAGSKVLVQPGVYEEDLLFHRRHLTLKAEVRGQTTVIGSSAGAVLTILYPGLEPVLVDGFVFEGGGGYPWQLGDDELRLGGGVMMIGAPLSLSHVVLHHNQADVGGGVGALLSPRVELQNVGVVHNHAGLWGGGISAGLPGLFGQTEVVLSQATVADNDAAVGSTLCISEAAVTSTLTILDGEASPSLCMSEWQEVGGLLRYTALAPDDSWQIQEVGGEVHALPDAVVGPDSILHRCGFEGREWMDYHLVDDPNCQDVTEEWPDFDDPEADMGMYGGVDGDWDWDRGEPPDDDDDAGPDDDDVVDDDDAVADDDDAADDDDSALGGLLPSGLRCDCHAAADRRLPGLGIALLGVLALRRRR
jgi:hypothetical protein